MLQDGSSWSINSVVLIEDLLDGKSLLSSERYKNDWEIVQLWTACLCPRYGINVFMGRGRETRAFSHPEHTKEKHTGRRCLPSSPEKRPQNGTHLTITLILDFWPPELWEINFYGQSHPVYSISLWQPELTSTALPSTSLKGDKCGNTLSIIKIPY